MLGGLLTIALLLCGALVLFVGQGLFNNRPAPTPTSTGATQVPVFGQESLVVTNTPRPTLLICDRHASPTLPDPDPDRRPVRSTR